MEAALTFLRFVTPVIFGVGTVITLIATRRAPLGREDEDGFHFVESSDAPARNSVEGVGHISSSKRITLA
jgi:hypothetical protein